MGRITKKLNKLKQIDREYLKWRYTDREEIVFNRKARVVMTYSEIEKNHQLRSFENRILEVQRLIKEEIRGKSKSSDDKIRTLYIKNSKAERYLGYNLLCNDDEREIHFKVKTEAIQKKKEFGKRLLFSYDLSMSAEEMIRLYHDKYKIEDLFRNFKGGDIVDYTPIYHWTDSKIVLQSFVNVLAYLLIKLVEKSIKDSGIEMSISNIVEILEEIEEAVIIYSMESTQTMITEPSKIHKRFIEELNLRQFNTS